MKKEKGKFITFEGPDGSGKTTIIKKVYDMLVKKYNNQKEIIITREPGGTNVSEKIREILVNEEIDKTTEALLFSASRAEHVFKKIIPSLNENKIVLCDRFLWSSLAYQGHFKGLGMKEVLQINKFAIKNLWPDLIIYIDVPIDVSIERLLKRESLDKMDSTSKNDIEKINIGYEKSKKYFDKKTIKKINGNQEIEKIVQEVFEIITKEIEKNE